MNAVYYGSYASQFPSNAFGRSPLDGKQLKRLQELTGVKVGDQNAEMAGSQVSFTRPELSPCLAGLKDRDDPKYKEALAIIRAGQDLLAKSPREDMPGSRLIGLDAERERKYEKSRQAEAEARAAILTGRKYHPGSSGH
jgi:hypothetical protein